MTGFLAALARPSVFPPIPPGAPGEATGIAALLQQPYLRTFLPIPIIVALAPLIWWFFKGTWRELDLEAQRYRGALLGRGGYDLRPAVLFAMIAIILTLQEYYGGRATYDDVIRPWLSNMETVKGHTRINLARYDDLYGYAWWAFTRFTGYVLFPFPAYKFIFQNDNLLNIKLRLHEFLQHA